MKVAISATGKNLESTIDERFGRCRYFIIVETDDMSFDVVENTNADLSTSAGIQSASFVASTGAEAVITGNCGPKAMQVIAATNIQMILGQHGVIKDAIERFKRGKLNTSTRENALENSGVAPNLSVPGSQAPGMGGGGGRSMGGGGGRSMGGGGGRGMGGRCRSAYGTGTPGVQNRASSSIRQQERDQLKKQADELKKQMEAIQARIKELA
jgi:predicted Fe-Mo cluster-binding NifX family protein